MYFKSVIEFTKALYFIKYSCYDEKIKKQAIKNIKNDYLYNNIIDFEFENVYKELTENNFTATIDEEFINKNNGKILSISQLLKQNVKIHYLEKSPFVTKVLLLDKNKCFQCGNINKYNFFYYKNNFKNDCIYCKKCISFKNSNNINYYFKFYKPQNINYNNLIFPKIKLSSEQEKASNFLIKNSNTNKKSLIWAVCGAGKTEIIYELLYKNLKNNKIICIAIPRKDIVNEIYNRLKKDFKIEINILHGEKKQIKNSNLYITTTHQLIDYYNFFDIIIVDEVDAFPFSCDDVLEYSAKKSLKKNSPIIFLSATPSKKIQKAVNEIYKIPIRYHNKLLPIPKIKLFPKNNEQISKELINFINNVRKNNRRALIFVPTIEKSKILGKKLNKLLGNVEYINSKDAKRREKLKKMYNKNIDVMITTTILERGVTFDYLDVLIYEADNKNFSKEALIQIAGRVGRKHYDYSGKIIFLANKITSEMKKAIKEINKMNELAKYRKLNK